MPLYAAALFGKYEVVKYLYHSSSELSDDEWTPTSRGWLLEKCVENDMFDVAIRILNKYPNPACSGRLLGILARKRHAFFETKSNIIQGTFKSVSAFIGLEVGVPKRESEALHLLRMIWSNIAKRPKREIDSILRGPPDSTKLDHKSASELVVQAMQLRKLIYEHCNRMHVEIQKIIECQPMSLIKQDTNPASVKIDQGQQLENLISERLVLLHRETENIYKQDNKTVSGKGDQALKLQDLVHEHIENMHRDTQKIIKTIRKEDQAQHLQKLIVENIEKMHKETHKIITEPAAKETYSSRVQFIAAEMGNTIFLIELIRQYPDLLWKVNDENQSIFHIAVKYRHVDIYNLLYEIGAMKDMITPIKDQHDNNMLHLVGMTVKQKGLEDESITALHMQRELLWFKEVESMIPPSLRERRNRDGQTPQELFINEHKEMVRQAERWMKEIASQCIVVGALVATMVFAAAFTVPGGYDQDSGIPIFHSKTTFKVFVVADGISLFLSSASVLYMFLSLFTSSYTQRDFLEILPRKLIVGLSYLFLSITAMIIAVSVNFFVLYQKDLLWMPILISGFALIPFCIYVKVQYVLFVDLIRSTYRSRYLFKPKKYVLYYENPRV